MHFGFSYIGLLFVILLMIPTFAFAKSLPKDQEKYNKKENKAFKILERVGEVLILTSILIFRECNIREHSVWNVWLLLAFLFMILYECYWIRYFRSEKTMKALYRPLAGFKVAGASLPTLAILLLGIYAYNIIIIISAILFGIGQFVSFESSVRYEYEDALQKANEAGDDTGALRTC